MSVPMDFTKMDEDSSESSSEDSDSGEEEEVEEETKGEKKEGEKMEGIEEEKSMESERVAEDDGNPSDVESDDDEDDAEDDLDDEVIKAEIVRLRGILDDNPFHYDSHVSLVAAYKKTGELTSLRSARQTMSELFPLTPSLWREWIEDERRMDAGRDDIDALFRRAVEDYVSVETWFQWCMHAIGSGDPGVVRSVFESALSVVGLHVAEASCIWEAYREFETATLASMQSAPGAVAAPDEQEKVEAQTRRLLKLFERQLGIPHLNMETTMAEYVQWVGENNVTQTVKKTYAEAEKRLPELLPLEDALGEAAPPKLEAYKKYIEFETEKKSPARIQLIYERALVDNCLDHDLWAAYGDYLDRTLKIVSKALSVYRRATRNCPWSAELWRRLLLAAEKAEEPKAAVDEIYGKALGAGFSAPADYGKICLAYLDFMRRRCGVVARDEKGAVVEDDPLRLLRAGFQQALDFLATVDKAFEEMAAVSRYWARFEAARCGNMEDARRIWIENIFPLGYNVNFNLQMEFINLERAFGSTKHCRRHFHKALNVSGMDYPEALINAYLDFEREEGSVDDLFEATAFVEKQRALAKAREEKRAEKESGEKQPQEKRKGFDKGTSGQPRNQLQQQIQPRQQNKQSDKRSFDGKSGKQNGPPPKRKKQDFVRAREDDSAPLTHRKVDNDGFKVPSLPVSSQKPAPLKATPNAAAAEASKPDEALEKRDRTVFVSNLHFSAGESDLREAFKFCGPIESVRLVSDTRGKPRGFGYVEFAESKGAEAALKMDRYSVKDRPLYISKIKEKGAKGEKKFVGTIGLEPKKLFVKNLPAVTREDAVKTMFEAHGKVLGVRLVTMKSGKSKGMAYVEFETEEEAKKAMLKTDGSVVGDNVIEVAISNTPKRRGETEKGEGEAGGENKNTIATNGKSSPVDGASTPATDPPRVPAPHLGGGKKETVERGKARTQVALVPRAAASMMMPRSLKKPANAAAATTTTTTKTTTTVESAEKDDSKKLEESSDVNVKGELKKSNDDFRKMFLK